MDLFYTGPAEESLAKVKVDLKAKAKRDGQGIKNKKLYLVNGDLANVGNNILFVGDPLPPEGFMKLEYDRDLLETLNKHEMHNYFVTYCYLLPRENKPTRNDVKDFRPWIHRLVDILLPKLIVVTNETPVFSFFNRKVILRDNHGTIIGHHGEIPVIQTYPMIYFKSRSEYEDMTFKLAQKKKDWDFLKTQYDRLIK